MAKSAIFDMTSFFFYKDIFENGLLYRNVLIEYFQRMYRFNTIGLTVDEINAFEISKKCYFLLSQHFFWDFKCIYLVNGIPDSIKPMHFLKVLNEDFTIKQTVFKYIQVEKNDVISKMADFARFWPKNANISWTIYPIMINHTIFFILNSGSIR